MCIFWELVFSPTATDASTETEEGHYPKNFCQVIETNQNLVLSTVSLTVFPVMLNSVELPADSQKLKRHIALLCDRIGKGGSLGGRKEEGGSLRDGREVCPGSNLLLYV